MVQEVDARKERYGLKDAKALLKDVSKLIVAKGKKVVRVDLRKDPPDDETLAKLIIGPSGNLRAPTLKVGKTLVVGYHDDLYEEVFG